MSDIVSNKERAGLAAHTKARQSLLDTYRHYGLDEGSVATAIKDALTAKKQVEVLTNAGWDISPGQPDHKTRLSAANMLADLLDLKSPIKVDLRAQGILTDASRSLVEEILVEQGLIKAPPPLIEGSPLRSPSLRPSSFLLEDGFPAVV